MENERYILLPDTDNTCTEIILSKVTDIKIKVYSLQQVPFSPDPRELQLYAENRGELLAFETAGLYVKNGFDVFTAVKWYARQRLDNPGMLITVH